MYQFFLSDFAIALCGIEFETDGDVEIFEDHIELQILTNEPYKSALAYFELKQQDNFTLTFKISSYYPDLNYQQLGLYIYTQGEQWGKFMRSYSDRNIIEAYGTENSWTGGAVISDVFSKDQIYMKLKASNEMLMFFVSNDGENWDIVTQGTRIFDQEITLGFSGATYSNAEAYGKISEIEVVYE